MRVLLTGGSGRLGGALRVLRPDWLVPSRAQFDLLRPDQMAQFLDQARPDLVVHAAAYTDVAGAEQQQRLCWSVNVEGTRQLVRAVQDRAIPLVHISTDYVFWGDRGGYHEDDPPGPVRNYYALSKLVAEELVRLLPHYLIIRTSFRSWPWPYPAAYTDLFTSQDYLERIAPQVALAVDRFTEIPYTTLHIATQRKSAFELAVQSRPDVRPGLRAEAGVALPADISLDTGRWQALRLKWGYV